MRLVARDFLHYVQIINRGEKIAEREISDRFFRWRRCGISQLIHFRAMRTFQEVRNGILRGRASHGRACGSIVWSLAKDRWRNGFVFARRLFVVCISLFRWLIRVEVTEMEKSTTSQQWVTIQPVERLPQVLTVIFLRHGLIDILVSKHLQDQRHIVRIQ